MNRDEVIRKVAALLRLAERGGTVHEAGVAAARAQEMMDKYSIDSAALAENDKPEPDELPEMFNNKPEGYLDAMGRIAPWRFYLARGIALANDCYVYKAFRNGKSIEIVGRPTQVATVRELYAYLTNEVISIDTREGAGMGATWRREFKEGAALELGDILKAQREATIKNAREQYADNSMALVRVESALAKMDNGALARATALKSVQLVRSKVTRHTDYNPTARDAGRAAAHTINTNMGTRRLDA